MPRICKHVTCLQTRATFGLVCKHVHCVCKHTLPGVASHLRKIVKRVCKRCPPTRAQIRSYSAFAHVGTFPLRYPRSATMTETTAQKKLFYSKLDQIEGLGEERSQFLSEESTANGNLAAPRCFKNERKCNSRCHKGNKNCANLCTDCDDY